MSFYEKENEAKKESETAMGNTVSNSSNITVTQYKAKKPSNAIDMGQYGGLTYLACFVGDLAMMYWDHITLEQRRRFAGFYDESL